MASSPSILEMVLSLISGKGGPCRADERREGKNADLETLGDADFADFKWLHQSDH